MLSDDENKELKVLADWLEENQNPICQKLRRLLQLDDDVQEIVDWIMAGGGVMAHAQKRERGAPFDECSIVISTGRGHQTNAVSQPLDQMQGFERLADIVRWIRPGVRPRPLTAEEFRRAFGLVNRRSPPQGEVPHVWPEYARFEPQRPLD